MKLIDANIFMYAAGKEHPNKRASLKFLSSLASPKIGRGYCTNAEVVQEIFHRYQSINRFAVATTILETILALQIEILPIEYEDLIYCHKLMKGSKGLSARDAIHAAVIERRQVEAIVSFDKDFDKITEIKRIEPGHD